MKIFIVSLLLVSILIAGGRYSSNFGSAPGFLETNTIDQQNQV